MLDVFFFSFLSVTMSINNLLNRNHFQGLMLKIDKFRLKKRNLQRQQKLPEKLTLRGKDTIMIDTK